MLEAIGEALTALRRTSEVVRYSSLHDDAGDRVVGRLVFNLAYGWIDRRRGRTFSQPEVARRLRAAGARLIGSDPDAQEVAQDKLICGQLLVQHGIAVPHALGSPEFASEFVIRKPRFGASHRDVAILDVTEAHAVPTAPDVLLQEYVPGPEFTVGVVAGRALPAMHVVVGDTDGPTALGATPGEVRLLSEAERPAGLGTLAERIGAILGLSDYYRVDIRMRGDVPVVLDVNALPSLDQETSFLPILAEAAGWSYGDVVRAIVCSAERRLTPRASSAAAAVKSGATARRRCRVIDSDRPA